MMLADPGLVVAELVEMLEQGQVAPQSERRILVYRMERREKNSTTHPVGSDRGH